MAKPFNTINARGYRARRAAITSNPPERNHLITGLDPDVPDVQIEQLTSIFALGAINDAPAAVRSGDNETKAAYVREQLQAVGITPKQVNIAPGGKAAYIQLAQDADGVEKANDLLYANTMVIIKDARGADIDAWWFVRKSVGLNPGFAELHDLQLVSNIFARKNRAEKEVTLTEIIAANGLPADLAPLLQITRVASYSNSAPTAIVTVANLDAALTLADTFVSTDEARKPFKIGNAEFELRPVDWRHPDHAADAPESERAASKIPFMVAFALPPGRARKDVIEKGLAKLAAAEIMVNTEASVRILGHTSGRLLLGIPFKTHDDVEKVFAA
ncbi:hypothetical protein MNEG_14366 [Monoraphidium neglectum]|uniref:Uncharacterized protein n=1 Tax=Monoraphidium neglectum TaxID=145388 RepID=A0A0D2MEL6_9CHLO|nr:hypothetical protein MNEG_14366 [Monoraphidium neglectum]KIY93595.1 hypothetical protein MNEG_14366 [Monoraphidium neglectum]|eukprot:XP_013892615.1 hypothetical protein MNEG_14366 [Monoraphidium neglectum]